MNPWFVVAGVALIEKTPNVARLVIITQSGGNSLAELFCKPSSVICSADASRK
ncbi:MAG: hypothetical protein JOY75_21850 [Hyphomicrobiales bacterium]|nr:hypothetical protein [Hyphomicrobiales bacterium]